MLTLLLLGRVKMNVAPISMRDSIPANPHHETLENDTTSVALIVIVPMAMTLALAGITP